ncbi:MAG TPA: polysaccharide biosynthesis/export family protein [Candidatus Acidoferrales bacterium]|nr:polysaccharide biosynthesis/export family protein [Candidatus Acidoferrales bacterium]
MLRHTFARILGAAMLVASFASTPSLAAEAVVHSGDQLTVDVFNHPELSGTVTVDSRGHISLPLVGDIDVTQRTPDEVAGLVYDALTRYIRKPGVTVRVAGENTSLFVTGGGEGVLKYASGETLASAVADFQSLMRSSTGKPSELADLEHSRIDLTHVGVLRDGQSLGTFNVTRLWAEGAPGPSLVPGDTIQLPDKPISVDVVGAVDEPGLTYLSPSQPLTEAITQSGGLTPEAASGGIVLERDGVTRTLALADPVFLQPAQSGDVVTIPEAPRVSVVGQVSAPGQEVLKSNFTLLNALYVAGGPTKWANLKNVQVVHNGATTHYDVTALTHGDVTQNPTLSDGDLVMVPEGHRVDYSMLFNGLVSARWLFPL